jgi:hypothetical protein
MQPCAFGLSLDRRPARSLSSRLSPARACTTIRAQLCHSSKATAASRPHCPCRRQVSFSICTRSTPPLWHGRCCRPPLSAALLLPADTTTASRQRGACSTCMGAKAQVMRSSNTIVLARARARTSRRVNFYLQIFRISCTNHSTIYNPLLHLRNTVCI